MGLDVSVYWGLVKVENPQVDGDGNPEEDNQVRFFDNTDFPGRLEGLEPEAVYQYKDSDEGFSGGYGGYNRWRENLAKLAGYPTTMYKGYGGAEMRHDAGAWVAGSGPFYELINFTDCDGTIGPVVAKKIAADFAAFQSAANGCDQSFLETYNLWRKSFEQASDNGAVQFH